MKKQEFIDAVKFDENGLVVCVIQDYHAKKIRMVAYMNKEALIRTLDTKEMTYYSRSRKSLWVKGETSGYYQYMRGASIDCDGDALLFQVEQKGGISCHTGNQVCFYRDLEDENLFITNRTKSANSDNELINLEGTIGNRIKNPVEGSYTNYLIDKGENKILKKVGEEATETVIACKDGKHDEIVGEIADLIYHLTVEMQVKNVSWNDVFDELKKR
ncbi:MAG: bifunctional phosphoribosyl-AMP cyclohydrolase/phosphoribosyl-ATP diphosphatase HisIE [Acholeplasmatales bacterium]|nr:bifunctional phosphoribosyl-AMP cyclohydrolase/phosphoribosyl-ATP diphosphatase HisIE [Acholeplasmatales bacterium]